MMRRILVVWLFIVAILGMTAPAQANLILNGSFETGLNPGNYATLGTGSANIAGWTITGSIDYIGSYWVAADGSRSIDLNGYYAAGSISQSFATVAGQSYHVEFYMAGNPAGLPAVKTLVASGGSVTEQDFTFDKTGHTLTNMGWEKKYFDFIASGSSTTLTFASSNDPGGAFGAALDKVSVTVPEAGTLILLGSGLLGLAIFGRKKFRG